MIKTISFGNNLVAFDPENSLEPFLILQDNFGCKVLVCLKQTHSTIGVTIKTIEQAQQVGIRKVEGDFLVTNQPSIALALLTADCLPLMVYDPVKCVVAAIHAGWRGSVARIADKAVRAMQQNFGSKPQDLQAFFGPCAKVCCYQVGQDFVDQLQHDQFVQQSLIIKKEHYYFDNVHYNSLVLMQAGLQQNNLNFAENQCTICATDYCSVRRDPGTKKRNISFVTLK